ncbi:AAA-domain-containing protein [Aureobasidium subglaciale]|nr:AAA-domain-containing protein [Aureobasidium subglaciale]
MLGRGKPAASMQKTYDDCYLTCSTAVYFEGQNNETEALRSWRNALDQIYYHNAYRMPTGWRPRSETERALQESLRQMELQCKERVDLLEALRQSREEAADSGVQAKATASSTSIPLQESADQSSNSAWLGGGSIPPVGYSDISRPTPPSLPTRTKRPSYTSKSSSGADVPRVRASPAAPAVSAFPPSSMLAPQSSNGQRKSSRTPSPEKRGGMLRTLRAGGKERTGSSGKLASSTFRRPAAASKAATQAWGITQRNASVGSVEQANGNLDGPSSTATVWDPYTRRLVEAPPSSSTPHSHPASAPPVPPHSSTVRTSQEQPRPPQKHVRPPSPADYFVQPSTTNGSNSDLQRPPYPDHSFLNPVHSSQAYTSSSEHLGPPSPITSPRQRSNANFTTANTPKARRQSPVHRLEPVSLPSYRNEYPPAQPSKYRNPPNARPPKTLKDLEHQASSSTPVEHPASQPRPKVAPPIPRKAVGVVNAAKARQQLDDRNASSGYSADEHSSGRENPPRGRRRKTSTEREAPTPIVEAVTEHPEPTIPPQDEASEWDERVKNLLENLPRGVDEGAAKQIFNEIVIQGDEVHWDDVAGLEIAKSALKETVVYPFLRPDLFMGLREPARGMLLFGPPGTGKTMLARAVATESKSTFFAISASSLTSKYLGESEKLVRALFSIAKALAPSIIFVDEIDSLLSARGGSSEHEATRRIKTEFLIQWSDLAKAAAGKETSEKDKERGDASRVLVLAATNLPWAIDEAARRRFVRRQYIPLPEEWVRKLQLTTLMAAQKHNISDEDLDELVYLTEGFSGSDITALAKDAAMGPLRSLGEKLLHMSPDDIRPIDVTDFKASLINIRPSVSASGLKEFEDWAKEFGERGG